MNSVSYKYPRTVKLYARMPYTVSTQFPDKFAHLSVHPHSGLVDLSRICFPPVTSFIDGRENDLHLRKNAMEVQQVLLHHCDKLHTFDVAKVVAATVNQQDIRDCSSSQRLMKKGKKVPPSQTTPAKPPHTAVQSQVPPCGVSGSLFPTSDVAVSNQPHFQT